VTHHIEEILRLFGKTLVLREGWRLYTGRTRQVLKPQVLDELYGASIFFLWFGENGAIGWL
jgi:ABC-type cobalamin transport system ATPase subunit